MAPVVRQGGGSLASLPCEAVTRLCLPDDLDQTGLVLVTGSVATATMLCEDAGEQMARVLGVPLRVKFLFCMDVLLDAQAHSRVNYTKEAPRA